MSNNLILLHGKGGLKPKGWFNEIERYFSKSKDILSYPFTISENILYKNWKQEFEKKLFLFYQRTQLL
jgi:hypothetical protein